jgi:signal transduction histidine kinase
MKFSTSQTFRAGYVSLSRLLKRSADSSDLIWLGRFRLLTLYTLLKSLLLLAAGVISASLRSLQSGSLLSHIPLVWIGIFLGMTIATLLLFVGLVVASHDRTRSRGLLMLGTSDLCILLAVVFASLLNNLFLLLITLVFLSCTTPLLIERISRYARRFQQSSSELENMKNAADMLLLQLTQNLAQALERERMSLKREIHDGLMQELCALSLQISLMIRRKSEDGALRLDATEVVKLETALRRAVTETRSVMAGMQNTRRALDTFDTIKFPIPIP